MAKPKTKMLTQAEYAAQRNVSRQYVAQLVAAGRIPTIDGQIDPVAADEAMKRSQRRISSRHKFRVPEDAVPSDRDIPPAIFPELLGVSTQIYKAMITAGILPPSSNGWHETFKAWLQYHVGQQLASIELKERK